MNSNSEQLKILVVGGSGFIGSHIADALSEAGHAVTIYDIRQSPYLRPDQTMVLGDILDYDQVPLADWQYSCRCFDWCRWRWRAGLRAQPGPW